MTPSNVSPRGRIPAWLGPALLLVLVPLVVAACFPAATPAPGSTPTPTPVPTTNPAAVPLAPATPDNPFGIIAWLFTPIFQVLFIILVAFEQVTNNIAIANMTFPCGLTSANVIATSPRPGPKLLIVAATAPNADT